jgi:spermidine synthase
MEASYVDLVDASHLEFDYMRLMQIVLRAVRTRRLLHLRVGGCALARALAAEEPSGRQLLCEVDGRVLALAPDHLVLCHAPELWVRYAEGRAPQRQAQNCWDPIVMDAFVGAVVSRPLVTSRPWLS